MGGKGNPDSYVILTRSQKAEVSLMGVAARGSLEQFEQALAASSRFRLVYANEDAKIFTFVKPRKAVGS
jgi:hypothetical protein